MFFLAATLITPVVLYRVVQVVTHRVQQPEVVEQECKDSASSACSPVLEVIVVAIGVEHQAKFHKHREFR